ncbi:MAG: FeoB-associated Cys-rich membrane protein [Thermoplasmata archaeon]|nr:FeoB-associated Cys-rich membrane protein [Thermoplasmata archaeon]
MGDLIVGAVIILLVVAAVGYMIWQRKKGVSSCGCKDCSCGCGMSGKNVQVEGEEPPACCQKKD